MPALQELLQITVTVHLESKQLLLFALTRQTAVAAYFPSEQILLFALARQTAVTAYFQSEQLLLFARLRQTVVTAYLESIASVEERVTRLETANKKLADENTELKKEMVTLREQSSRSDLNTIQRSVENCEQRANEACIEANNNEQYS